MEKDLQVLIEKALAAGASAARVVDVNTIKTGSWTRWKCQYGCPNYGKTLCCPPYSPDYEATQRFLSEYQKGIIVQYTMQLDPTGPADFERADLQLSNELLRILLELEREAFLLNHYKAFALKAGKRFCLTITRHSRLKRGAAVCAKNVIWSIVCIQPKHAPRWKPAA